ncbi:hypothetical protein ASA1KI_40440 [Opitutales bacterium ASA1]|uniref:TIGR04086 family membrane protein n=1 Tax=Congregicoccus parvus TaxID=3081749 RepID=UPI002B2F05E4|nr:hypothetical protein ASA1KI_40440 [Opitutales bacterium ASA1]
MSVSQRPLFAASCLAACLLHSLLAAAERSEALRAREAGTAMSPLVGERLRLDAVRTDGLSTRLQIDPARLGLAPVSPATRVLATDLAGMEIPSRRATDGTVSVDPTPGQWVVLKPSEAVPLQMKKGVQWLPGVVVPPRANDDGGRTVAEALGSYAEFAIVPIVWDVSIDAYRLVGRVGVARNGDRTLGGELGARAIVRLAFDGLAAEPAEYTIEDAGAEGERPMEVVFTGTLKAQARLIVRSNLAADQPFLMDVRPRIDVKARNNPILGLGLEETIVVVQCVEAHGAALALPGDVPVEVETSGGRDQDASAMRVSQADPRREFRVRSVGFEPIKVAATARLPTEAIVGSVTIRTTMPWVQLAAALLGGALGGFARRFVKGARRNRTGVWMLEGLVVALVAFVAGVLGVGFVGLPSFIVATVAGAFLTGTIGGFLGVTVIEKITSRVSPAQD